MRPEDVDLTQADKDILKSYKPFLEKNDFNGFMNDLNNNSIKLKELAISAENPLYIGFIQLLVSLNINFYSNARVIPKYIFKNCRFNNKNIVLNNCETIKSFSFHGAFIDSLRAPICTHVATSAFTRSKIKRLELPLLKSVDMRAFDELPELEYLDLRGLDIIRLTNFLFERSLEIKTLVLGKNTKLIGNTGKLASDKQFKILYGIDIVRV